MPELMLDGASVFYMEQGQGRPVVLVHGFPLDGRMWEGQLAALSDKYRVIVPDLPGFGRSAPIASLSVSAMADTLHKLLHQLHATPCVLGGLSMGGYVAFDYITKYPTDLAGLMLIDTRCEADTAEAKTIRMKTIEAVRTLGAKAVTEPMEAKLLADATRSARPDVVQRLREIMEQCSSQTIEQAQLALATRCDYRDKLASIAVPTLIIVGDCDAITPPDVALGMNHEIPHAQLCVVRDAGHMSPMEQPEQVNQAIGQFLDQVWNLAEQHQRLSARGR